MGIPCERIQAELSHRGHPVKESVVYPLLCIYCLHPEHSANPIESLNSILDNINPVNLTQFYILPGQSPAAFQRFGFGRFTIGTLNASRLESRSRKAGSDYYARYHTDLLGKLTIERDSAPVKALAWRSIQDSFKHYQYNTSDWNLTVSRCSNLLFKP
jgi:hypothetical protein